MAEQAAMNTFLSGKELASLIKNDIDHILNQDTMLQPHVGYRGAAYSVTVKIMTKNPIIPDWTNKVRSKKSTEQQISDNPAMTAVEAFPLKVEEEDEPVNLGVELIREIVSPNQSRIENGLPVPITRRTAEGNTVEELVHYDVDSLPEDSFPDGVTERELSDEEIVKDE
jgi:hypothetical protein